MPFVLVMRRYVLRRFLTRAIYVLMRRQPLVTLEHEFYGVVPACLVSVIDHPTIKIGLFISLS